MFIIKKNCPVPFDQQPINEYLSLKKSCLFSWSISQIKTFLLILVLVLLFVYLTIIFCLFPFFSDFNTLQVFLLSFAISNVVLILPFIRLYLGWSYIAKRLLSATIFYEESGWYDGQMWVKTSDYLMQDRLVGLYEVMPFIIRIRLTFLVLFLNLIFSSLLFIIFE